MHQRGPAGRVPSSQRHGLPGPFGTGELVHFPAPDREDRHIDSGAPCSFVNRSVDTKAHDHALEALPPSSRRASVRERVSRGSPRSSACASSAPANRASPQQEEPAFSTGCRPRGTRPDPLAAPMRRTRQCLRVYSRAPALSYPLSGRAHYALWPHLSPILTRSFNSG